MTQSSHDENWTPLHSNIKVQPDNAYPCQVALNVNQEPLSKREVILKSQKYNAWLLTPGGSFKHAQKTQENRL